MSPQIAPTATNPAATPMPIFDITSRARRLEGRTVATSGILTGIERGARTGKINALFIQDARGDGKASTSDAVYVKVSGLDAAMEKSLELFTPIAVTGKVRMDGPNAVLQAVRGALEISGDPMGAQGRPKPVALDMPMSKSRRETYLNSLNGMVVALPNAMVVDPTAHGEFIAVDEAANGPMRRNGAFEDLTAIAVSNKLGQSIQANTGTRIQGVAGPLHFANGDFPHWQIGQHQQYANVVAAGAPPRSWGDLDNDGSITDTDISLIKARQGMDAAGPIDGADLDGNGSIGRSDVKAARERAARVTGADTFRVASYNLANFFDKSDNRNTSDTVIDPARYATKLARVSASISQHLGAPQVIALQEVENEKTLKDLVERPELAGMGYRFAMLPSEDPRGISTAILYRGDSVKLKNLRQFQPDNPDATSPRKGLFSRPPLVADLEVSGPGNQRDSFTIVVNHLKSHYSPSGAPTEPQRLNEARSVNSLVKQLRADSPEREVLVLGDMNDGIGSKPIQAMLGGRRNPDLDDITAKLIPKGERYSYSFRGSIDLLDHIMATGGLTERAEFAGVRHVNTDFAEDASWGTLPYGASDHDPVVADFRFAIGASDARRGARNMPVPAARAGR